MIFDNKIGGKGYDKKDEKIEKHIKLYVVFGAYVILLTTEFFGDICK